jgi:hypothetical protein
MQSEENCEMTKSELLKALEPYTDDIEIWMRDGNNKDASVACIEHIHYEPKGIDDDYDAALVVSPSSDWWEWRFGN